MDSNEKCAHLKRSKRSITTIIQRVMAKIVNLYNGMFYAWIIYPNKVVTFNDKTKEYQYIEYIDFQVDIDSIQLFVEVDGPQHIPYFPSHRS